MAALIVVFHHSLLTFPGSMEDRQRLLREGFAAPFGPVYLTPLRLLVDGQGAVLLFFVLSGLVLALRPASSGSWNEPYIAYLTKRVCRIWLPFAAAIVVAIGLTHAVDLGHVEGTSDWFAGSWLRSASGFDAAQHLAMTGDMTWLDNPMWSLVHEMRISILFPLLVALSFRSVRATLVVTIVIAVLSAIYCRHGSSPLMLEAAKTSTYLFLFAAGVGIALPVGAALRHRVSQLGRPAKIVLWLAALALFSVPPKSAGDISSVGGLLFLFTCGAASTVIVLLCAVDGLASRVLQGPVTSYLGRISYSLYLTHVLVILTVVHTLGGVAPVPVLVMLAVPLSIMVAHIFNRGIEVPAGQLGRWLEERMSGWKSNRPTPGG